MLRLLPQRFRSLGWKLTGATVLVVTILAVTAHLVVSKRDRKKMMTSKERAADMVVQLSAAALSAPLTFGDGNGVQEQIDLLRSNDEIVYAGAWSAESTAEQTVGPRLGWFSRGVFEYPKPTAIPADIERRIGTWLVEDAPVFDPTGKVVGMISVAFSLEKERLAMQESERQAIVFLIAAAGLVSALLLSVARITIVRPLRGLANAANRLERGDTATIDVQSQDEIGDLASALRSMSQAIRDRERRLSARNRDMRLILDHAGDGFLTVSSDGVMADERSRMLDAWFGPPDPGENFFAFMGKIAGAETAEWLDLGWESLRDGILPTEVALAQLPKRFQNAGRSYALEYRPINNGTDLSGAMLVVIRDVTAEVERNRSEERQRESLALFQHYLRDRVGARSFLSECRALVNSIVASEASDGDLRRNIHTLKGNTGLWGLQRISNACHDVESRWAEKRQRPSHRELVVLADHWREVEEILVRFGGSAETEIILDQEEHRRLLEAVRSGVSQPRLEEMITALAYEPASRRLDLLREQVQALGQRLGKSEIRVHVEPTPLRLPPRRWERFWPSLVHVFRNSVDHGLESATERARLGKDDHGNITVSVEHIGKEIVFSVGDDGRGIAWDAIATKAQRLGLEAVTKKQLEDALFSGKISSKDDANEISGRGIGMSAVNATIRSLGGTISISSIQGQGTILRFSFPESMLREDAP